MQEEEIIPLKRTTTGSAVLQTLRVAKISKPIRNVIAFVVFFAPWSYYYESFYVSKVIQPTPNIHQTLTCDATVIHKTQAFKTIKTVIRPKRTALPCCLLLYLILNLLIGPYIFLT